MYIVQSGVPIFFEVPIYIPIMEKINIIFLLWIKNSVYTVQYTFRRRRLYVCVLHQRAQPHPVHQVQRRHPPEQQ